MRNRKRCSSRRAICGRSTTDSWEANGKNGTRRNRSELVPQILLFPSQLSGCSFSMPLHKLQQMRSLSKGYVHQLLRFLQLHICLFVTGACFSPNASEGAGITPDLPRLLALWQFDDTNWFTAAGYPPKASFGIEAVPSWRGTALKVGPAPALLNYDEVEP